MAGDEVEEIKSRLDIAEVVGDYVALTKKGRNYWGRCPFHNEKTPSFAVSPEKQTFHCFGCGKGGDIFTFVMEMEHLDFREALERLAERAGVKLVSRGGYDNGANKVRRNILAAAQTFFRKSLESAGGTAARAYLKRRSITPEIAARFGIGWSPASWNALTDDLKADGFSESEILESGLASQGNKGIYDRFRGRVMFPIYNTTDKLIGFGGRIIDGDGAKYLNSPESSLFNKRNNLYLLNKAKLAMKQQNNSAILVEGYMDAIRAHVCGFTNAVASLGTSLTEHQAALIKRMTGLCYICYDSDSAGQEAALRGMYILQKQGVSVKVVRLRGGKDPDEILLQEDGKKIFQDALDNALPLPLYHAVLRQPDIDVPEKSLGARNELLDGLASLSVFDIEPYMDKVAQILGVFPHELQEEIESRQEIIRGRDATRRMPEDGATAREQTPAAAEEPADDLECEFCSLLWGNKELRAYFTAESVLPFIKNEAAQNIVSALLMGEEPAQLEKRWRDIGDEKGLGIIAKGDALTERENTGPQTAKMIITALRNRSVEKRIAALQSKLKKGTATDAELQEHFKLTRYLKGGKV
jgi:DNA primase